MNSATETSKALYKERPAPKADTTWKSWVIFLAIAFALYVGNGQLQTFLGKRAIAKLDYPQLTLEQAFAKAASTNKTVLVDMSAVWCPSCRKLDSQVFADSSVKTAIDNKYIFVRVEYESPAGKAFAAKYDIRGFPTLLVLNPQGDVIRYLHNTYQPNEFLKQIN